MMQPNDPGTWIPVRYVNGLLDGRIMPEDWSWAEWKDKYGKVELARLKYGVTDHFYPPSDIIKEEDIVAWRPIDGKSMRIWEPRKYPVSETTLEAEWMKNKFSFHYGYYCSNCYNSLGAGYPPSSFKLGEFCSRCGARMKNPQLVSIEYDYD